MHPTNGFEYYDSALVGAKDLNWGDASVACFDRGAQLASVHSKEENLFIFNLRPKIKQSRWLGARRDRSRTNTSPYSWTFSDGTPFDIFPFYAQCIPDVNCLWQRGDPNDLGGKEDCVQMGHKDNAVNDGAWSDALCSASKSYICKREGRRRALTRLFP